MKNRTSGLWMVSAIGILASGCVGYSEVVVTDVNPYDCRSCGSRIEMTIDWRGDANLDLELLTPSGELIAWDRDGIDGCYHYGDDMGGLFGGTERIVCEEPIPGIYEVRLVNVSSCTQSAAITIRKIHNDGYADVVDEYKSTMSVDPWGLSLLREELP